MLAELARAQGAVEPDDQRVGVADAVPEGLDGLAGEGSARRVDDRPRDDQRQAQAELVEERLDREDRRLRVERVEDRLDQQEVGAAFDQPGRGLAVGDDELVPGDAPGGRVQTSALIDAVRFVGPREPATNRGRSGSAAFRRVRRVAGEPRGRDVQLADRRRVEAIVGLGDPRRGERVRAEDLGAGIEVAGVDRARPRRAGSGTAGRCCRGGRADGRGSVRPGSRPRRTGTPGASSPSPRRGRGSARGGGPAARPGGRRDRTRDPGSRAASSGVRGSRHDATARPGDAPGSGGRARRTARTARSSA